ncbi:cytochrome P450 [Thermoactinospora rubra]|uniref:cytochrome P450 n=1 Tax=Thermoactinospora rubra TaxID=1088767 RepID=UPI000A10E6B9|nr:cytochrome P450 [Thermoactinospora rubra]
MTATRPSLPFDRPDPMAPPPRLRASAAVAPVRTPDGRDAWLVTSYEAVTTVLSDPRFALAPPGDAAPGNDTLFQDGEAHLRLRRLVSRAFTPRSISALRPRIEAVADARVASMAAGEPPADLVADLAAPLSITVIGELLGVALDDRERFQSLAQAVSAADFLSGAEEDLARAAQAWEALGEYAADLVATKRARPGDDLLSALIAVRDADDGRLGDAELVAMVTTIVSAGYLSAANAISVSAIRLLLEGRLADLAAAETDAVVEEVLRLQSGLTGEPFPRYAQVDLELAGVGVRAGDMLLVRLEAAQRDPAHFAEPDRFHPEHFGPGRDSSSSLAFGHGPHYCLGAALARAELTAALGALARRLPGLRLAVPLEEIEWTRGGVDIGPTAVPVAW